MVIVASAATGLHTSEHHLLGEVLCELGKLTERDIGRIVLRQRQTREKFGEAAESLGLVSREDVAFALARQFEYPCAQPADSKLSPLLVSALEPFGPAAEMFRVLRGNLMLSWFNDRRKSLVVTATRHGEGTSVIAANLAIAFAQLGERTLLIDTNMRRPGQHELFNLPVAGGLSALLAGRLQFKQALCSVPPFNTLSVLCAGVAPPNPHELLSSVTYSWLMESATAAFDIVISDCPPMLEYPDGQVVAARNAGCLLTTRRHETSLQDVEEIKRVLAPAGTPLVGALINE
jgi:chain length determinant protein tyrosine kinase EpsG